MRGVSCLLERRHWSLLLPLMLMACQSTPAARPPAYVPAPGSYFTARVEAGDRLADIASRYRVERDDLLAFNGLKPGDTLAPGMELRIPAYGLRRSRSPAAVAPPREARAVVPIPRRRPQPSPKREQAAAPEVAYVYIPVPKGAPSRARLSDSYVYVPVPRSAPFRPSSDLAFVMVPVRRVDSAPAGGSAAYVPDSEAENDVGDAPAIAPVEPLPRPLHRVSAVVRPDFRDDAEPSPDKGERRERFLWPVVGRVIAGFGEAPGGGRNDGINISARRGTPVRAAAAGTVTYVGNELKGYGNLVLIRHDNGYVTAYAHSDKVIVRKGDHVARGQVIGYAGTTGDVVQPQLHFELRLNTRPVDPERYLLSTS